MKRLLALLLVLVTLFALTACSQTEENTPTESNVADAPTANNSDGKKVLRIGTIDAAQSYSPVDSGSLPLYTAYEFLTRFTADGSQELWLAESLGYVDDLTYQIKLRDGIYFANGNKMTGEDVLYSIYYAATATGSVLAEKFTSVDFDASRVEDDGMTVTLSLTTPYALLDLWMPKVCLTEKAGAEERGSSDPAWWDQPISSSAYTMVENVDGSHVTFKARNDYWDADNQPVWDEITFYYYSNATAMFIAFENGELDMLYKADTNDYARALAGDVTSPETTVGYTTSTRSAQFLVLGGYCDYFQDPKVREAVAYAVDGDSIASVAFGTYTANLDSSISPKLAGYIAQGEYEYDVEYAKQCMAESAYPNGFEVLMIGNVTDSLLAEVLQAQLAEIGISLVIENYDFPTMIGKLLQPGASDIGFWGGTLTSFDAYDTFTPFHDGNGITVSRILDEEWNEMYDKVSTISDLNERLAFYGEMQDWMYENMWAIPLFEPNYTIVYNNSVVDCQITDLSVGYVGYECFPAN